MRVTKEKERKNFTSFLTHTFPKLSKKPTKIISNQKNSKSLVVSHKVNMNDQRFSIFGKMSTITIFLTLPILEKNVIKIVKADFVFYKAVIQK